MSVSRHMSREVVVTGADGETRSYGLAIATVTTEDGLVIKVEVKPFEGECEAVTYHDRPLTIEVGKKLRL